MCAIAYRAVLQLTMYLLAQSEVNGLMSYGTSPRPKKVNYQSEGSPDNWEEQEPANPLRTSTLPAIFDTKDIRIGETGTLTVVNVGEDDDISSESQDSGLTHDEITQEFDVDTDPDMRTDMGNKSVLIVEDSVEIGEVIQATLEGMGLDARHVVHGKLALEMLPDFDPQVIFMDIGLPDITGWKMLDHIREYYDNVGKDEPPVIVITAYGDPANRLIGKLQNIHSYLIKPFTPDQVENVASMALRGERPDEDAPIR